MIQRQLAVIALLLEVYHTYAMLLCEMAIADYFIVTGTLSLLPKIF